MTAIILALILAVHVPGSGQKPPGSKPAGGGAESPQPGSQERRRPPEHFTTPLTLAEMTGKQAVLETTAGRLVIDLLPEASPNHVGYFIKLAREGAYDGTTFHRAIANGIIQGGDPLSKDPAKRDAYGTGGLGVLKSEVSPERHSRGSVSGVILPGKPDSGGAQFFICVVDQPALDGQYTVFGRVVDGMNAVRRISESPVDERGKVIDRVEITSATVRDKPVEGPEPFSTESAGELAAWRATIETTAGRISVDFRPDKAPGHVRAFLRMARAGVFDGTAFHRVVPGFVIQAGALSSRREPLEEPQQRLVRNLQPEFNDLAHLKGTLSMARGDDPASATTSFFICTAPAPALDGKYTAFGRVVEGLEIVEAIEKTPVDGETPRQRIDIVRVTVQER